MKGKKITNKELRERIESDKTLREKVFKELCQHLRGGYSLDCFETLSCGTIEKYIKLYPEEFDEEDLVKAMRQGKQGWENIGRRQAEGTCLGNSRSWYYNMSNRYKWSDKQEVKQEHSGNLQVSVVSYASTQSTDDSE